MRATVNQAVRFVEVALPEPGKSFGPWIVEHPVGQGGFGAVYRARDARLGRTIALKVMLEADTSDPESVARFLREARLAAALEHPHVVRILDVGTIDGTPYIAMEWIDGTTLGRAKIDDPAGVLTTIAETLAFAHERGIVHRDLKPSNVMIDREGRPKLVDFGIAKRLAVGGAAGVATFATRDGVVLGTPRYMAPEQELTSNVDARADQWAWAAVAHELLTGVRPALPATAHPALDPRLGAVILRALAIAPTERYASMRELLAAWKDARAPHASPAARPVAEPRPPSKAKLFIATTVAVTSIACVGLAFALFVSQRANPVSEPAARASNDAAAVSEVASVDAEAASASEPSNDAAIATADAAVPKSRPSVPPGMFVVRTLGPIIVQGSSWVDREALMPQVRALHATFERCFTGLTLPVDVAGDAIFVDVDFRVSGETRARWREGRAPQLVWPPASTRPCIEATLRKLKVTSTQEGRDAYALFRFDPKR
jgi:serine/threonine protein kinase